MGGPLGAVSKTFALLLEPLRHINNKKFRCVVFRRSYPQITQEGGLWEKSLELYGTIPGAVPLLGDLKWTFPSGATLSFAHLQHALSVINWQGAEVPLLCFDELTQFSEQMFFYMLSRNRSMSGVSGYVRCTCNPDADSWVADLIAWWIDQDTGYPIPERSGVVRWFLRVGDELDWADSKEELIERHRESLDAYITEDVSYDDLVKSLTFIPANIYDNPILLQTNPAYLGNLLNLDPVEKERLLRGNWKVRAEAGKVFNRDWFGEVDAAPPGGIEVFFWDFAATAKKQGVSPGGAKKKDPDFTAGVSIRGHGIGRPFYITHSVAEQLGPVQAEQLFKKQGRLFIERCKASGTLPIIRFELEPGSAARRDAIRLIKMFPGVDICAVAPSGDKLMRAKPMASQAHAGNYFVVKGGWNNGYLQHMHHQPEWSHDDTMDASSGAHTELVKELMAGTRKRGSKKGSMSKVTM
jgi:predicted phage terminase large subunit-like protein